MFNGKDILITGGTGTFGKCIVRTILQQYEPRRLIIFSRDELKQSEMQEEYGGRKSCLRYFLGDVRDPERLKEAFHEVNFVVHAAALKQVPAIEYNPFEAIQTNVLGAQNVIRASILHKVKKIIALSTDKAANPVNLYGASKLCSDKLFVAGNSMSANAPSRFSAVRYGNVFGSRGSVVPLFLKKRKENVLPLTDKRMTRFSITTQEAVDFVLDCFKIMEGGELFVPKIPSYRLTDLAKAIAPDAKIKYTGIRPGEKIHELMIPEDEARKTLEFEDYFVVQPDMRWWEEKKFKKAHNCVPCKGDFSYVSDSNPQWLSVADLKKLIAEYESVYAR
ncbi:MAG: UDP-N-acetylglucosamine 4,6-dehydratase (inverting) [Fibrobacteria bacterium]|nr:UDP-N-acetylglucosamine 4,6-dehydratase (inverting) [Fibrobacteria bacterium]